jgi:protease-4
VHTDGVGTTPLAGAFDVTKPMDPQVSQMIQSIINKGYADFTGRVAAARHKSVEQIDQIARGRVWTGQQAMERGLVDQMGGLKDAIADAAARAKLGAADKYRVQYVEKELSPFEQFLANAAGSPMGQALVGRSDFAQSLLLKAMPHTAEQLKFVQDAMERKPGGKPVSELAYCFCGL